MKFQTLFVIVLLLSLLACTKLTRENYNKVTTGMPCDEVVSLLGASARCDDAMGVQKPSFKLNPSRLSPAASGSSALKTATGGANSSCHASPAFRVTLASATET